MASSLTASLLALRLLLALLPADDAPAIGTDALSATRDLCVVPAASPRVHRAHTTPRLDGTPALPAAARWLGAPLASALDTFPAPSLHPHLARTSSHRSRAPPHLS